MSGMHNGKSSFLPTLYVKSQIYLFILIRIIYNTIQYYYVVNINLYTVCFQIGIRNNKKKVPQYTIVFFNNNMFLSFIWIKFVN